MGDNVVSDVLEQLASKYDGLSERYDNDYISGVGARGLMMEAYDLVTWEFISRYLPEADSSRPRALDAGGGTGKWALRLVDSGLDVCVIDLSAGMLEQAQTKAKQKDISEHLSTAVASILEIPYPSATFDFVLCEGDPVSYCLDDRQQAVNELVRVARPGAHIILGVDNLINYFWIAFRLGGFDAGMNMLKTQRGRCPYGLPIHAFTPQELSDALSTAGAEVIRFVGKPLLTSSLMMREPAMAATLAADADMRKKWLDAELWLSEQGYFEHGGHLQVVARKPY